MRQLHDLDFHLRVSRPWPLPLLDELERETQIQTFRERMPSLLQNR